MEIRKEILPPVCANSFCLFQRKLLVHTLSGDSHQQIHSEEKSNLSAQRSGEVAKSVLLFANRFLGHRSETVPKEGESGTTWVQCTAYKF